MSRARGFTIVEFIVATLVLSLLIITAVSFFIYQSSYGGRASKQKNAQEMVTMAMIMMRRDIMMAGFGLPLATETPGIVDASALSICLRNMFGVPVGDSYKQLFTSYGTYCSTEYNATPSIYDPAIETKLYVQGSATIMYQNPWLGWFEIGGMIGENPNQNPEGDVAEVNYVKLFEPYTPQTFVPQGGETPQTVKGGFPMTVGLNSTRWYAPAIVYKLVHGQLLRNGQPILGERDKGTGGDDSRAQNFRVNDIHFKAEFFGRLRVDRFDDSVAPQRWWSPTGFPSYLTKGLGQDKPWEDESNYKGFEELQPKDIILVEVTVEFQMKQSERTKFEGEDSRSGVWSRIYTRSEVVCPRTLVLQYGQPQNRDL